MSSFDVCYAPRVEAAAARLDHAADRLRQRSALLHSAAAACEWDGAGARAFRERSHAATVGLRHVAAEIETAVAALRRHAGRVADDVARRLAAEAAERDREQGELREAIVEIAGLFGHER